MGSLIQYARPQRSGGLLAAGEPHILDTRHHEMSLSCWCEPRTALDGHRNDDGAPVEFAATDQDPVGVDGWLMEVIQ